MCFRRKKNCYSDDWYGGGRVWVCAAANVFGCWVSQLEQQQQQQKTTDYVKQMRMK